MGAGALFAALTDLVTAEQYDREEAGRAVDEALDGMETLMSGQHGPQDSTRIWNG